MKSFKSFLAKFTALAVAVVVGLTIWSYIAYPKVVASSKYAEGKYTAEVVVTPATRWPKSLLTLVTRKNVHVVARVRKIDSSKPLWEETLTRNEESEEHAEDAQIQWVGEEGVDFTSRKNERLRWTFASGGSR